MVMSNIIRLLIGSLVGETMCEVRRERSNDVLLSLISSMSSQITGLFRTTVMLESRAERLKRRRVVELHRVALLRRSCLVIGCTPCSRRR